MKNDIERRIDIVRNDQDHGSRWLMREAVEIMRDLASQLMPSQDQHMRLLCSTARELAQARPAMAALASSMGNLINIQGGPDAIAQEATRMLEALETTTQLIAHHAQPFIQGWLMTCSLSGTVLDVLQACRQQIEEVIVLEGRPRYEGRDMGQELSRKGIAVTLITDAQADIFLSQCQGVVVGADSILADGSILNKAGTALLAWAARGHTIPLYVVCETWKISWRSWSDDLTGRALLEEKDYQEVLDQPEGMIVRNFYFDRTPFELVTRVITERGILDLARIRQIAAQVQKNRVALDEC